LDEGKNMSIKILNKHILILLYILLTCTTVNADSADLLEQIPSLGLEGQAQIVVESVCAILVKGNTNNIDKNDDWKPIGTGFFCSTSKTLLVATCHHVVSTLKKKNLPVVIGLKTDQGFRISSCKITNIDEVNDIAILVPQKDTKDIAISAQLPNSIDDFGSKDDLVIGRGLLIPGFPLAIGYQEDSTYPAVRTGIIAQYTGSKRFLIDGVASHGQSGSPVYTIAYKNRKLVGMITSHVTDRINLFDENGNITASLPYNSGLARAVTIDVVKKAIMDSKY
jgi:hypothetical protein